MSADRAEPIDYARSHADAYVDELKSWIAIPSISADPERRDDVRRCCETIVQRMRSIGLQAQALQTRGNPIAFGTWLGAPGKPTAIVYGHYDVQPVDPIGLWRSPPFDAEVRDGNLYGRGAVDDKGQVLMHLAAIEAHLRTHGSLPLNLKVIVEGEEEIGSPNFEDALATYADLFAADFAIVSDTAVYAEGVPSLTTSIRGLVHWEVTVRGPDEDLHSGYFGGIVANPIESLCRMIAGLKDSGGRICVPGFYDGVDEIDETMRKELETLAFDERRQAADLGVPQLAGESRPALERMWFRPTLECNGIWGGYQGPGSKTIVPSWAKAKLSARLVGRQDPEAIKNAVRRALESIAPPGVRVEIEAEGDVRAVITSRDHPAVAAAARAMEAAFGKAPVFIGTGGTIGPVSSFDRILRLPQVLMGVGLPDDRIHAPNEKFNLNQFHRGIEAAIRLYGELGTL